MAPLRSSYGPSFAASSLSRKSMPALANAASGSISRIYPPLPKLEPASSLPTMPIPGGFPLHSPSSKQFVFGAESEGGISKTAFSSAAEEVLAQMNARLPGTASKFSQELLRGTKVGMDEVVSTSSKSQLGGWGLGQSGSSSVSDRFAAAHEKEFAR